MAALICESFSKLCSGCTEACGSCCHVLAVPCQKVAEVVQKVVCSPFFPFIFITLICNIPSILSFKNLSCTWSLVNAIFCGINIVACFYMVHKLQQEKVLVQAQVVDEESNNKTDYQTMPASETRLREAPAERLKQVLCYDAGVAIYIVVFILWICWLMYGFNKSILQQDDECDTILSGIMAAVAYITIAGCAFGCSLLCLK